MALRMISVGAIPVSKKILDMVPDFVDKFVSKKEGAEQDPEARKGCP